MGTRLWNYKRFFLVIVCILVASLIGLVGCGPTTYTLTVNVSPPGAGSVSPPGGQYESGIQVTLTATPASGYTFDYWEGSASGSSATITITMDSDKNVIANFTQITYDLTIGIVGNGTTSPPAGVHSYPSGTGVELTATPDEGWEFNSWSGDITDTSPTVTITMDSNKSVAAHFEATPTVLFSDDFSDESSGWDTYSDECGSAFYQNGWFHLINYTDAPFAGYSLAHQWLTDFILEVETKLVGGSDDNWHSVVCRRQDNDNYYAFGISADGYYLIAKCVNGNLIDLAGPGRSVRINQGLGVTNLMNISCIGSNLSLSVNGHLLREVIDTTFTGGDIDLSAHSLAGTFTEIAFDNIVVTQP